MSELSIAFGQLVRKHRYLRSSLLYFVI